MAVGRLHDNDVVPSRAEGRPVSILERPVVFGIASQIGGSGKAHPASVARGRAVVAMAAAEADHYTAAAGEFVDSSECAVYIHRESERRGHRHRDWATAAVHALGSCCWKASFRLLGIRAKARRFTWKI
jgi:hypothetical protein